MKLTKAKQKQLDQAYDTLIQVCLYDRPLRDMEPYLADDVMNFGAGKKEITKTKAAFLKQIKNQKKLAAGLKMDFKFKPVLRKIINKGDGAIYTDDIVNTVWVGGVENKLKFRLSFIFEYRQHKWIMVHSHTSTPDPQRSDDEVWPVEELKKRTAVLEKSLDEKIAELEIKNRELEIEAALERVRSRAMAMHKTDELLEAAELVSKELSALGIQSMNISYAFVDENEKYASYYSLNPVDGKIPPFPFVFPHTETAVMRSILSGWKKREPFHVIELDEKATLKHQTYIGEHIQKEITKNNIGIPFSVDAFLAISPKRAVIYSFNFANGYLFNIGSVRLTPVQEEMLLRFTKVFEMAYRRFLDIKQAQAQAREAQIEAAVEKVRSRSLAMHKSDELQEVVHTVFERLKELNVDFYTAIIILFTEGSKDIIWWLESKANHQYPRMLVPFTPVAYFNDLFAMREKGADLLSKCYSFDEKNELFHHLFGNTDFKYIPEKQKQFLLGAEFATMSVALARNTGIQITTYSKKSFSDQDNQIFKRFTKVFDQAYTRFLDLQKAEAQAREAQIETALERVRSRSMAMQKSEELKDVIQVVYEQFVHLNILIDHTGFIMDYKARQDMHIWLADRHEVPSQVTIPYFDCAHWNSFNEAKEKGRDFFANQLSFEEKNRFYHDLFRLIPGLPEEAKEYYFSCPGLAISTVLLENVGLYIENFSGIPYTDEENNTLMRFGKVFQQTYTRFLDLQNAEAQARETQIQLALERVRARTMAMHKSAELGEISFELVKQVQSLGIATWHCAFNIYDETGNSSTEWGSNAGGTYPRYKTPREGIFLRYYEIGQTGETLHIEEIGEEKCAGHYAWLCTLPGVGDQLLKLRDSGISFPTSQIDHVAYFKYGYLIFITYEPAPEAHDIFKRFAKVFEQTYTRFLDLQKAEAQAREAQIELGLERVRARAMAMQKSDELKELIGSVSVELTKLDVELDRCFIAIFDPASESSTWWMASPETPSNPRGLWMKYHEMPPYLAYLAAWEERKLKWQYVLEGAVKKSWDSFLFRETEFSSLPDFVIENMRGNEKVFLNASFNSFGCLTLATLAPVSEENFDILLRFAKVFDLTYTRFNDLQKAEAQAREAKIEAALERVRSKAMAMHKSEDLSQAVATVFEELDKLDLGTLRCGIGIINKEKRSADYWVTSVSDNERYVQMAGDETMDSHPLLQGAFDAWLKQEDFSYSLKGDDLTRYYKAMVDTNFPLPESQFVLSEDDISEQYYQLACFEAGGLFAFRETPFPEEAKLLMKRFAGVFNLTYKRFLDLQKAEAQAREAQVQLALERVRARTMAMQKSVELLETSQVLYRQLKELGEPADQLTIGIVDEQERVVEVSATREDSHLKQIFRHSIDEPVVMNKMYEGWKAGKKSKVLEISGEDLKLYNQYRNQLVGSDMFPTTLQEGDRRIMHAAYFSKGMLALATVEPRPEESIQLLERFATVFELTYTRFLDLQKAEAQARESGIEASLERVRSKAMAMHSSQDLADTIGAFYRELQTFSITPRRCGVGLLEKGTRMAELSTMNTTEKGGSIEILGRLKMEGHPVLEGVYENWLVQKEFHPVLRGNEIKEYYQLLKPQIQFPDYPNDSVQFGYFFYFTEGGVYAWTDKEMAEEELKIYRRFTTVLSLTYKRYKELKEAEAQTRESQIELGLERVRARAMAMQKSEELKELIGTVFTELTKLDLVLTRCLIMIFDPKTNGSTWWMANSEAGSEPMSFFVKYHEKLPYLAYLGAWQERKLKWQYVLEGKDKLDWDDFLFAETELSNLPDFVIAGMKVSERVYLSASFNNFGNLTLASLEPLSPEQSDILLRFAKVFDLTYTRFNDLKQAEAQARQAKIEAAMEKVRSRALAMQKPDELVEVAEVLRKEMGLLGVEELETSSIYIHNEASGTTECWFAMKDTQQEMKLVSDHMTIDLNETAVGRQMLAFYHSGQKQISLVMRGAERKEWIQYCAKHAKVFGSSGFYGGDIPDRTYHLYKFSSGYLGAASPGDISAESWDLLQRATSVFSLAYTRFSDLQQAEASAKEAVKQAALDRIRAEIASMRTTSDLEKITPLIWKELTVLGIPFIRCGVFIMDDSQQLIHTFLSTPDGKAIAAFHLPYSTPGNLSQVVRNWQHKEIYVDHWDDQEFIRFSDILAKQGALTSAEQYLKTIPQGGFYLHFLPFLQGMLYAGNTTQLGEEDIKLLQSVADAFSTAYARYEDFNKLEAAKQQVDKALTDLKQTQQQLVQSEKMASLGELTAGIAHEIQNPLNFVNNFAQVSNELLSEMVEEVSKGNYEEANQIAGDVKLNLEKIDYHGKRADAIVKGMLQHSRTSSGQKELTDINDLTEEYLRLAYHGWRAKDKSFNAKFETEFDPAVGKINVTSQDIGRVILNLINNAFYAVAEKKKQSADGYEPLVSIRTKRANGHIEISVKDSGNGIPQQVLEKIFQPFFTTKPTGQGTGLGLSLSYDIVKAHGGEIRIDTKENVGSSFTVVLPA